MRQLEKKFLTILVVITAAVSLLVLARNYFIVQKNVDMLLSQQAAMALKFELAIRQYVSGEIRPRVTELLPENEFVPETMSTSFIARSIFDEVRKEFPDYLLKFSSDNPRNPANLAGPDEMRIIEYFNINPDADTWTGELTVNGKRYIGLFSARRMDKSCLQCHGDPADAPKSLVARYGERAGFYRRVGEVIALDTVAIPKASVQSAQITEFLVASGITLATLILIMIIMMISFRRLVSRRLGFIANYFDRLSRAEEAGPIKDVKVLAEDEIGLLARSFNTLAGKIREHYLELENRVEKRTRELEVSNEELVQEINERKRAENALRLNEERMQALLELLQMADANRQTIADYAIEQGVLLTRSNIGILGFLDNEEKEMTVFALSENLRDKLVELDAPLVFSVENGGLFSQAVRRRDAVIINDYSAPHLNRKGLPKGHVPLYRILTVPVSYRGKIVALAGVANKEGEYDQSDVRQLTLLMEGMWKLVQQRTAEKEHKKLEEQLLQSQKMEAVGRLAGGVAHDFNNLLTGITGFAELIGLEAENDGEIRKQANEIKEAAGRGAELTQQLLAFSRRQVVQPRAIEINRVIEKMRKMLGRMISEDIDLVFKPTSGLPTVMIDPSQIEQVLINLAVNARDAMPKGGLLTITTSESYCDEDDVCECPQLKGKRCIVLEVTDNGVGIDHETRDLIFEPFFTTKEFGKGTGLGLATVYGIVEQAGGHIEVESQLGQGTTFRIFLPTAECRVADQPTPEPAQLPTGKEIVMVVEDEKIVRDLTTKFLRRQGYAVLEAENGEHALSVFRNNGVVDLLLTDVVMPQMNGKQLADHLKTMNPELQVLFMSGYTKEMIDRHGVVEQKTNFINKPFDLNKLARKVREVLDAR